MEPQHLIPAADFCVQYNIETSFLHALQDYGLLQVTTVQETHFIEAANVPDVERIIRLHRDLAINLEGVDAILQLLKRLENGRDEIIALRNRLRLYEG